MFKIESYLTPYISAYLARYVTNFKTDDFQVSFWQGGATFNDVILNLEALEAELNLPAVTLVSGHIHELKISVPWTKITSEPITVHVNTIEIVLKLRGPAEPRSTPAGRSNSAQKRILERKRSIEEPTPSYMQHLTNRILQNAEIVFENVVLKYTEDDAVLSLNIRNAALKCVDSSWEPAFIELIAPAFILRKCWTCSDLTVCLDKPNNVGKIETYMDPLLYKCSFDVRVLYQYHGPYVRVPYFVRYDLYLANMHFSISDEQIPMVLRLVTLINILTTIEIEDRAESCTDSTGECAGEEAQDGDSMLGWASWAVSWVPSIPEALFGPMDESMEPLPECEFSAPVCHYGIFIDRATIILKAKEAATDESSYYKSRRRVKFLPFLKCQLQGTTCDVIIRGLDIDTKIGVSELLVSGMGSCPCGLNDCDDSREGCDSSHRFIHVGKVHKEFACESMFNPTLLTMGEVRPPADYHFNWDGHFEDYTEEKMLNRTPGIAFECFEVRPVYPAQIDENSEYTSRQEFSSTKAHNCLSRLVIGPLEIKVNSSSIHRAKLIQYSSRQACDGQYAHLRELVYPKNKRTNHQLNAAMIRTFLPCQLTILKPTIEVSAGDHPDYDRLSHIRAACSKRRSTNVTPLSQVLTEWPKLIISCESIDGSSIEPTLEFRRLVECWTGETLPETETDVISAYTYKCQILFDSMEVRLVSGEFNVPVIQQLRFNISHEHHLKPCLKLSNYETVQTTEINCDSFRIQVSKPNLMLCHVIVSSCFNEDESQHLLTTTLLEDLPDYKLGEFILQLTNMNIVYNCTNTIASSRVLLRSVAASVRLQESTQSVVLFERLASSSKAEIEFDAVRNLVEVVLQYPLNFPELPDEVNSEDATLSTPILAVTVDGAIVHFDLMLVDWLSYYPKQSVGVGADPCSPDLIRMSSHSLFPITPLSRSRSRYYDQDNISEPDGEEYGSRSSAGSTEARSQSYTGIRQLYRFSQAASTHRTGTDAAGSTMSFKSTQTQEEEERVRVGVRRRRRRSPTATALEEELDLDLDEFNTEDTELAVVDTWENWIGRHLCVIRRTFISIEIESSQLLLPVGDRSRVESTVEVEGLDFLCLETPKIIAHPEACSSPIVYEKCNAFLKLPSEMKGKALYPSRIFLNNMTGYSTHGCSGRSLFLTPFSIGLTLTLTERAAAEKSAPSIAAGLHVDIAPVKLTITSLQVKVLSQFVQKAARSASVFLKDRPSLLLPKKQPLRTPATPTGQAQTAVGKSAGMSSGCTTSWSASMLRPVVPPSTHTHSSVGGSELHESGDQLTKDSASDDGDGSKCRSKKASFWIQITLTQFQLILRNGETGRSADVSNQLVFEIEDVVSSIDVQSVFMKLALKVGTFSLRSYERNESGVWDFGKYMGLIVSRGDEITRDIDIIGCSAYNDGSGSGSGRTEVETGPSSAIQKHGFLYFTFTRVLAQNFHKKADVASPTSKWNSLLRRHYSFDFDGKDRRMLNEFDIKLKTIDIVLCPKVFLPFKVMLQHLLTHSEIANQELRPVTEQTEVGVFPFLNNNSLPLIYLETEGIRLFMKSNRETTEHNAHSHDVLLLQIASVSLMSQSENPLHRTLLKPDLYKLAEQARILNIPGSPVEDRQYQLDVHGLSIVSCRWKDVEASSKRSFTNRSSVLLRAMGENPAFEWNKMQDQEENYDEVEAHLLLKSMGVSVAFAPPVVYERSSRSTEHSILIAGQVIEVNIPSQTSVSLSHHQLICLLSVVKDYTNFWEAVKELPESKPMTKPTWSNSLSLPIERPKFDNTELLPAASVPSCTTTTTTTEFDSGITSTTATRSSTSSNKPVLVPTDILLTCSFIEVKFYELSREEEVMLLLHAGSSSSTVSKLWSVKPLLYVSFTQPHVITHRSTSKQTMEVSAFDVSLGFGSKAMDPSQVLVLPQKDHFSMKLLRSIAGLKNPKTGITDPFFTLKLIDLSLPTCKASFNLFRPVRIVFSNDVLEVFSRSLALIRLAADFGEASWSPDKSQHSQVTASALPSRLIWSKLASLAVNVSQIVLSVKVWPANPAAAPSAGCTLALSSAEVVMSCKKNSGLDDRPDNIVLESSFNGVMLTSKLRDRSDIILSPWNVKVGASFQWAHWVRYPTSAVSVTAEPLSMYFGPQNILSALQLYHCFNLDHIIKSYFKPNPEPSSSGASTLSKVSTFHDDLRAGAFEYVRDCKYSELPDIYQIAFCDVRKSMTWRYPQPRYLSKIAALPVPLNSGAGKSEFLQCCLEYWEEAERRFKELRRFTLSETAGVNVELPAGDDVVHKFVSTLWRISIIPPLDEDESKIGVRPELLACLHVDSVFNPMFVQKLNLLVDISRITLHLANHLSFTGRSPEEKLARYSYKAVSTADQTFATIELSTSSLAWHTWPGRSSLNWMSYLRCTVVDYSFLTESVLVEPFSFQAKVGWNKDSISDLDFLAQPVVVKMGGTVLHTLASSFLTWSQALDSYKGNVVDLSGNQNKINVILTQIVLCNDTATALNVSQDGTTSSISLLMRQCTGFNWSSPKAPAQCKLRLNGEESWSKSFGLKQEGYVVRTVANNLPLFINTSELSSSQTMVTISGGLIIANALQEPVDVTIIPQFGGKEINYSIAGRSRGPSQVLNMLEIKEFQFKYSSTDTDFAWGPPVSLEDLKKSSNRSIAITLTCEKAEPDGSGAFDEPSPTESEGVQHHNVWCSLVEETIDNCVRYMVIVCPFFRVKSSLAAPTITHVSTGHGDIENSALMAGKGSEIQIDFVGHREATLHLTFQHCLTAKNSHSKPTIPLNPNGPALEKVIISRPIDEILSQVLAVAAGRPGNEESWPFIQEEINLKDWVLVDTQPETEVQVEFTPWIQGLPSILIDAKPCGLFVNITGRIILFSEPDGVGVENVYKIPITCVFTPSNIKESFKIGIDMEDVPCWTENLEFTEQKSRTDIHYVNSNWKIPIDCFSRVEIFGRAETSYLTLETRIRKGIIVCTIRSTYSIQNRTGIPINVKALSFAPSIIPPENHLQLNEHFIMLSPLGGSGRQDLVDPLLTFYSVSEPTGKRPERGGSGSGVKYLAIGCGSGPTWFVQLMKFELIFNNSSSAQGIPGRRLALSLQNCQAQWVQGTADNFVEVTTPITLSWTCKNGQVWISIAADNSPQILFFNESKSRFVIAESSGDSRLTYKDNDHFKQYLTLPSFAIAHFSCPSVCGRFPELAQSERKMAILLGKSNNLLPVVGPQSTSIYYETSALEWSNEISLTKISGLQTFRIGGSKVMEHYQLRVEQLGLSFYVYIQDMSTSEISAKDVRGRIAELGSASALHLKSSQNVNSESCTDELTTGTSQEPFTELQMTVRPEGSQLGKLISTTTGIVGHATLIPSPLFRVFLPLVRLILTDDFTQTHHKREILGLTLQDLYVDITPETDTNGLRILQDRPQENTVINVRLGDCQIDNALYEEKKYDFPVILKREADYKPGSASASARLPFDSLDNLFSSVAHESHFLLEFTGLVGPSSPTERRLQKVWLQLQPVAVYFEDKFLYFMKPVVDKLCSVVLCRLPQLSSRASVNLADQKFLPDASRSRSRLCLPPDILSIINEFSRPIRLQQLVISPITVYVTMRLSTSFYLAVDHSPLALSKFEARAVVTTHLALGQALSVHYLQGAILGYANPVRLIGSLELLGSPGSLARSFSTGVKDFMFYPIQGLFEGPAGFITGLTYGCSSLLSNVGSGTLTSVTNLAWSVSRNLDRLTLNEEEQLQREEDRRAPIDGVSDGILHGLTGFGIRLLGAIGGLAQHPIESVIDNGASPLRLLAGFSRGLLGVITKPIGGAVELVAMTGQGILTGAGWTPKLKRKHERLSENVHSCSYSLLKYHWMLYRERDNEEARILLISDATQFESTSSTGASTPVCLLLTTENIYIINTALDEIIHDIRVTKVIVESTNDNSMLALRPAPRKKSEATSLAEERLIDFVKGFSLDSTNNSFEPIHQASEHTHQDTSQPSTSTAAPIIQNQKPYYVDIFVDPSTKCEFITLLKLAQEQKNGRIFPVF